MTQASVWRRYFIRSMTTEINHRKEKPKERLTIRKSMHLGKIESAWSDEMDIDLQVYGGKSTIQTKGWGRLESDLREELEADRCVFGQMERVTEQGMCEK